MRRELRNSSIPVPRFESGVGLLNHPGGTYSHSGMIGNSRIPIRNCIWDNFLTPWNFKAGKSTSRLKYVQNQQILISQCTGSKNLRWQSQLTNL